MKNKLFITLAIIMAMSAGLSVSYAAETLDVPQNTGIEQNADNDKKQDSVKSDEQKQEDEKISDKNKADDKEKANDSDKEDKPRKFFSKAEKKQKKKESAYEDGPTTDVLVDSETIEYFPERHEFEAIGNAKVTFPSENSTLLADKIIFNHDTNFIKGYGDVVLIKDGIKVNGDYIQVNLNEDNAMITHPVLNHMAIKIRAKNAIVNDAQTEALDGIVTFNDKTSYKFTSRPIMGFDNPMMDEIIPKNFYFKEKYDNKWRLKAKTIIIDAYKDRDIATLKNADIYIKDTKLGSAGKMKLYTDKEQQYIETNMLELGSLRNLGAFISPGIVLQTPNASTLKIGPAVTYKSDFGVGAIGRFLTDKNRTDFGWSSSKSKFVVRGEQEFTDNLRLQYGINSYMSNGFLGGRMPKYGFQFVHNKNYELKDLGVNFNNRYIAGFARDWGDRSFSTTKFAWQTMSSKPFFTYKNPEQKFALDFGLNAQTHVALYGTGDTMGIVRAGPYLRTQYKSWQQYIGYFQGGQAGDSPFYFDKNFYGRSNVVLGESLRLCKYLTVMYTATIVLSNDTPDDRMLQENRFYFAIGPDDVKFLIGYDAYRQNASMGLMMNIGAENSDVEFKRLILNDPTAIGHAEKSEKQKMADKKKKEKEAQKQAEEDPMNRSVKDYRDYNPGFNMMPGGAMLQPSLIRPPGM